MVNPLVMDPWIWKHPGPFRVGDRVRLRRGSEEIEATVVEDRGNLGEGGKRMYGVQFQLDDVSDPIYTERVVDELIPISQAAEKGGDSDLKNGSKE